jgi:hypothetical protein
MVFERISGFPSAHDSPQPLRAHDRAGSHAPHRCEFDAGGNRYEIPTIREIPPSVYRVSIRKCATARNAKRQNLRLVACPDVCGVNRSVWSWGTHGDAPDNANPVHPAGIVTYELDRLAAIGTVRDDDPVGAKERDR